MNHALVLSGGVGTRMGGKIPKQYTRINGRMIITYALEALLLSDWIDDVYIVAQSQWNSKILDDAREISNLCPYLDKIKGFVKPGESRQESVWNGLQALKNSSDDWKLDTVLIHDAARPCLTEKQIADCYQALGGHDGVMPTLPMKDTVYLSQNGSRVEQLLDRTAIYAGQSPELFLLGKYYQANEALLSDAIRTIRGSTEVAIKAGLDVVMIPGDERNFKITTPEDLCAFELLMREQLVMQTNRD